jgi:hypothetical protein
MRLQKSTARQRHTSLNSHQLRHGLVQSLQPLHERFPFLIPQQQTPTPTPTPTLPMFSPQPYSLGLQPYLYRYAPPNANIFPISMSPRDLQARSFLLAASMAPPVSFLKVLLVFVAGGLFFSTAMAGVTACYAVGMDNIKLILDILGLVLRRVWLTFSLGMGATRLALLGEELEVDVGPKNGSPGNGNSHGKP